MDYAVDSNILIYLANPDSEQYSVSLSATQHIANSGDGLFVFPQNLIEFYAVATRPISSNGLGFTTAQASDELAEIRSTFNLIDETPDIYPEWERLVAEHGVLGKNVHDARIAAQMNVNKIGILLTFNTRDFQRFTEIKAIDPSSV